jgi:hypothetical protein
MPIISARYHDPCDLDHDTLDLLSLLRDLTTVSGATIRDVWSRMGNCVLRLIVSDFVVEAYSIFKILHICNLVHIGFNLGCAFSPTAGSLIAFRFLGIYFSEWSSYD